MKTNKTPGRLFYKVVAAVLLPTFFLSPISLVFAEETVPAEQTPAVEQPVVETPAPVVESPVIPEQTPASEEKAPVAPTEPKAQLPAETDSLKAQTPETNASGDPAQAPEVPQLTVDSKSKLTPQIDNTTGALQYSYPITVPPGRNGLTPSVALQYNSQNTSNDSIVGYGWNLSIPYIQRENKHGVDSMYAPTATDFVSSTGGELGLISGTTYGLHAEDGSFSKYNFSSNAWIVTTKSGTTYSYGTTAASRQDDAGDATRAYKWMLDTVTDANGNSISYTYYKDQGQIYPDTITYSNTAGTTGIFAVTFGRESFYTSSTTSYAAGFAVKTQYRINSITSTVSGTNRHSYTLEYSQYNGDNANRSLLATITENGTDPSGNGVIPSATKLQYSNSNGKRFTAASWSMPTHLLEGGTKRQDSRIGSSGYIGLTWPGAKTGTIIDINGDGLPDWIETLNSDYAASNTDYPQFYAVWLGTSTGWVQSTAWTAAMPKDSTGKQYQLGGNNQLTDVNGDGKPDWVLSTSGPNPTANTSAVWLNTGTGWTKSATWTMPTMVVGGTTYGISFGSSTTYTNGYGFEYGPPGYTYNSTLIDVNNDSLPDLVQSTVDNFGTSTTSDHYSVWLNTGTSWVKNTAWTMPIHPGDTAGTYIGSAAGFSGNNLLVDINADSLPDWVEVNYNSSSIEKYGVWLNTGTGWTKSTAWTLPVHTVTPPANTDVSQGIVLGTGESRIICNAGLGNSYVCAHRSDTFTDVNGDSLPDWVETVDSTTYSEYSGVWLNNGKDGWVRATGWTMPAANGGAPLILGQKDLYSSQIADINNDGLADFVASCDCGTAPNATYVQYPIVFINSGSSWSDGSWGQPSRNVYLYNGSVLGVTVPGFGVYPVYPYHRNTVLQDVNNDGSLDWIESNQFTSPIAVGAPADPYERYGVFVNTAKQADLLTKITYPLGAYTEIAYTPQVVVDKNATAQTQTINAVTSISTTPIDSMGGYTVTPSTTTYSYANGKYFYPNNTTFRKFAGFQKVTVTNPDTSKVISYYHQGNAIDTATYEYGDAESMIGKLYRTDITDSAGNIYKRVTTKWNAYALTSTANNFVAFPMSTITEDFDGNSTSRATAQSWTYNTLTGNITTYTNWGEVTATTPIVFVDVGTDKQVSSYYYATNASGLSRQYRATTLDQSGVMIADTKRAFDNLAFGSVTKGNETSTYTAKDATLFVLTKKSYNTYGLPVTSTNELNKVTTYVYDSYNMYPATATDPMSHVTQYTYDYMTGKVFQTTDENNNIYITTYDGLGRLAREQAPDPSTTGNTVQKFGYGYNDNSAQYSYWAKVQNTDAGLSTPTYNYTDGLGRTVSSRRQVDPNSISGMPLAFGYYQNTEYQYNLSGRLAKQSIPRVDFGTGYNSDAMPGDPTRYTSYEYDPLGRVLSITNAVGVTTYSYDDWKTTVTDPNGNVKKYYYNAQGNLVKVDEINAGSTYSTNYTWNLNGKLLSITDALGNVRNFTYDVLGRRLTAQDLHDPVDTTFGTWSYTYDDASNVTQSVSPNGATVNYTYDNDGRKLTEDNTGSAGTDITYVYDSCTQGIGKLCSVTMLNGANTAYTYNSNGAIASESKTIATSTYLTSYAYNYDGDLLTITYPDNAQVKYNYMSFGLVNSVQQKESGGAFANVASNINYSPDLKISTITYGNGYSTTNTYDAAKLYRLTNKVSVDGTPSNIQDYTYTYDANGNILTIVNAAPNETGKTITYTYDNLNRMKTAVTSNVAPGSGTYNESYTYDALGNITAKSGQANLYQGNTGTLTANPHAATSVNGVAYTYDNDGNMLSNGVITNTWNYNDQMVQSVKGALTITYLYDHTGNRALLKINNTNYVYPNKYYGLEVAKKIKQIYLGDQLIGTTQTVSGVVTPGYVLTDNLGSVNVVTSSTGAAIQILEYLPYGSSRKNLIYGTINEKDRYGGHPYDGDTDLYYYGARYYSGKTGKFVSQDPTAIFSPETFLTDPQQLNTYSYARNNPITNIDPDGKQAVQAIAGIMTVASMYAPQITSYAQSLISPLGQMTISEAINDIKSGNYVSASIGLFTAGELPERRITPMFDGLWSAGKTESRALNASVHASNHAAEFGIQSSKDYVKSTRDFITKAINNDFPAKVQIGKSSNIIRTYEAGTNTFSVFEANRATGALTPRTMFKPDTAIHGFKTNLDYFQSQSGSSASLKSYFSK